MPRQKNALLVSLVHIVDKLESEKLGGYLKNMGARHLNYNPEEERYDLVGASLLKTFAYFFEMNGLKFYLGPGPKLMA